MKTEMCGTNNKCYGISGERELVGGHWGGLWVEAWGMSNSWLERDNRGSEKVKV